MRPDWIGPPSLARLEDLGLSEETQDRIVGWLLDGSIRAPSRQAASPLVTAALELLQPSEPATAEELARLSAELPLLYGKRPQLTGERLRLNANSRSARWD